MVSPTDDFCTPRNENKKFNLSAILSLSVASSIGCQPVMVDVLYRIKESPSFMSGSRFRWEDSVWSSASCARCKFWLSENIRYVCAETAQSLLKYKCSLVLWSGGQWSKELLNDILVDTTISLIIHDQGCRVLLKITIPYSLIIHVQGCRVLLKITD